MSVWCSGASVGRDGQGHVRGYADGWSNHYPTADVEKPAHIDLATIADHCVPEQHEGAPGDVSGPWLRMSCATWDVRSGEPRVARGASVILDPAAARELAAALLTWADAPHVVPVVVPVDDAHDRAQDIWLREIQGPSFTDASAALADRHGAPELAAMLELDVDSPDGLTAAVLNAARPHVVAALERRDTGPREQGTTPN